jgi:phosphoenolpyruvate carboxykinase (ATP)
MPVEVPGVDGRVLDPRGTWDDGDAYDEQARKLADLFRENFSRFESQVAEEIRKAGPHS